MRQTGLERCNPRNRVLARIGVLAVVGALGGGRVTPALAGGGPQNVMLVVNARSEGSKRVANEYVRLRDIPAGNVVYLDYRGPRESAAADVFRSQILSPVFAAIANRGLIPQIDAIAYSTDFPWRISIDKDFPMKENNPPSHKPFASLTGATYLSGFLIRKHPGMLSLDSNWYVPRAEGSTSRVANLSKCNAVGAPPSQGFRSRFAWLPGGKRAEEGEPGRRYLLATVLGVTTGRGNTVDEVITSLRRASEADVDPPSGSVYFMQNGDVRSQTRHRCYREAAARLRGVGQPAEVRGGVLPPSGEPIAGLMTGANTFDVPAARLNIRPGAICEHLTSNGGMLLDKPWATPLSEWIRAGATGTCGAVIEPYAIQAKFPLPTLQLHYRRGCSMAEAFYQAVAAPYQLLVVGDPLCQPWAKRPALTVDGAPAAPDGVDLNALSLALLRGAAPPAEQAETKQSDASALRLAPTVKGSGERSQGTWEVYIDGRLAGDGASGEAFETDRAKLGPGWHELRVVGIASDRIAPQRTWIGSVQGGDVENPTDGSSRPPVTLRVDATKAAIPGKVVISATAPAAENIEILQNRRVVAVISGGEGNASIDASVLGRGPVRLQAKARPSMAASSPVWLTIE